MTTEPAPPPRQRPWHLYALGAFLLAIGLVVVDFLVHDAIFRDYSARFGTLTEEEFTAMNERMDGIARLGRYLVFGAVAPLDLATIFFSARAIGRRGRLAKSTLAFAVLAGLAITLLLLAATAAAGGGMIG